MNGVTKTTVERDGKVESVTFTTGSGHSLQVFPENDALEIESGVKLSLAHVRALATLSPLAVSEWDRLAAPEAKPAEPGALADYYRCISPAWTHSVAMKRGGDLWQTFMRDGAKWATLDRDSIRNFLATGKLVECTAAEFAELTGAKPAEVDPLPDGEWYRGISGFGLWHVAGGKTRYLSTIGGWSSDLCVGNIPLGSEHRPALTRDEARPIYLELAKGAK